MDDETMVKIAELWFNQDYSPIEIAQELSLSVDQVAKTVELLGKLKAVIAKGMLDRVKDALRLD